MSPWKETLPESKTNVKGKKAKRQMLIPMTPCECLDEARLEAVYVS